jgi:DHA2 family lincomycin resistance protein-like MFS transporter
MMNTVIEINPPEKRGSAMGLCLCAALLGPAMGPTVSGIVLQFFSWHALFFILSALAIISIIMGSIYLENVSELTKPKIDFLSILLSSIGFAGIIYGISSIGDLQASKLGIIIPFAVGVIALIFFSKRQLSLKQPMLELRAFKYPLFSIGAILVMITMMIVFSMNMILPMFLEGALKTTSFIAAVTLLPAVLVNGFMTPVMGRIYDKIGAKVLVPAGYAIICVFLGLLSYSISSTIPLTEIIILYCFVCLGVSMTMAPGQTNSLNQLPKKYYPHGVAIITTLQQIAAAIGSSLFTSVMSAGQSNYLNNVSNPKNPSQQIAGLVVGFNHSLLVALIIVLIAFALSLFLKGTNIKKPYKKSANNV